MANLKKIIPDEFSYFCYEKSNNPWTNEEIEKCKAILSECELDATYAGGYKYTALHETHLPIEIVEWLVERGADVNAVNKSKWTVLHFAVQHGRLNLNLIKWLVEQGVDVNAKDEYGRTILKLIPVKGNVRLVKWLKAHGAK